MFNKSVSCIVCEKELLKKSAIKENGVFLCSEECKEKYLEELKKIGDNMHLDGCC